MAATNPFRVSDLIAKYGWKVMPYLSNLGPQLLAEAQVLFVDSGNTTDGLDADDTEHGHSFEKPLLTWDYAIGLCTAGEKSVIFLAPGHNENLGNAQIDIDINDVVTIGIGDGENKPRIDFDHANSSIDIGGNNVVIRNINLLPSITAVLIGVHVESGVTGVKLVDVDFQIGEDGSGADEFVKAIELTSGNHDCVFENVKILAHASAAQATHGIDVAAASDRLTFRNVIIDGPYSVGGIVEAAAGVNHICEDCAVDVTGTNFSFDGSSTFAKRVNNVDGQTPEDDAESIITLARGTGNYPTGVTDNSILAYILGKGATASASTFVNTTDSLEAIRDAIDAIDNTTNLNTAVPATPTASSVQDMLQKDSNQTYDKTTDSLEAIADAILTGTNILAGINLDHLMKTAVSDEQNMTEVANGSALAHILVKGAAGAITDFDPTTDSLEAISDLVSAISFTAAVSATPTARSLQDILEKDGTSSFDDTTDSLEAIADRLIDANIDKLTGAADGTGNYPASVVQDSVIAMILSKSANPVASSYDNQTDSLEAIRDNQQTAARAAIDDAELDHLCELDGATQKYPENAVNDSIIAKILCKGDPATINTYDCTTDSLEAISDLIRTGTTALRGINLDYLMKTAVANGADLTTEVADGSVLSNILDDGGDTSAYDRTKHSLFAIGTDTDSIITNIATAQTELDKIGTIVNAGGTATIGAIFGDFANSSLVTRLGNLQTDADRWGTLVNAGGTAELGAMLGDFANVTLVAQIAAIVTDLAYQEQCVEKVATSTDDDLFDVTGEVLITSFVGIVTTTAIGGVQNRIKIGLDATDTVDCDFSTEVDTNGDVVGTRYVFSAANPAVLTPLANGAVGSGNPQWPWVCKAGVIEQFKNGADAGTTGQINWYITYKPLSSDGAVSAAA
jgi:hypothetical protein